MDRLENDLVDEEEKLKNITEEVESTFVELSGYWKEIFHHESEVFISLWWINYFCIIDNIDVCNTQIVKTKLFFLSFSSKLSEDGHVGQKHSELMITERI